MRYFALGIHACPNPVLDSCVVICRTSHHLLPHWRSCGDHRLHDCQHNFSWRLRMWSAVLCKACCCLPGMACLFSARRSSLYPGLWSTPVRSALIHQSVHHISSSNVPCRQLVLSPGRRSSDYCAWLSDTDECSAGSICYEMLCTGKEPCWAGEELHE